MSSSAGDDLFSGDLVGGDLVGGDPAGSEPAVPSRRELAPGAIWVPGWLSLEQQAWLVDRFDGWAAGPVPPRGAKVRGHEMSVATVCLGWHWRPYAYSREAVDVNGQRVLPMPGWMVALGRSALLEVTGDRQAAERYTPDTALVNLYDADAKMGMHQDKDEQSLAPVVSLSVGDTCRFRFGNTRGRTRPYEDIDLASGDLFVFGGPTTASPRSCRAPPRPGADWTAAGSTSRCARPGSPTEPMSTGRVHMFTFT